MVTRMWQSFRKTGDAENSVARVESQTLINPIGKMGSQNWRKIQNLTIFHGHRQLGQPRKKHYKTIQSHSEDSCIGQLNAVFQIIVGYGKILSQWYWWLPKSPFLIILY